MKTFRSLLLALPLLALLTQCAPDTLETPSKLPEDPNDIATVTMVISEYYAVEGDQDNVVAGTKGTLLTIPKGSLVDENGNPVTGKVDIELAEAYSQSDKVLSGLTTTSNGKPLESKGMIYFNATSEGKQLGIAPNNPVYIDFPTTQTDPGYDLFYGKRDGDGVMEWEVAPQPKSFLMAVPLATLDFGGLEREEVELMKAPTTEAEVIFAQFEDSTAVEWEYPMDSAASTPCGITAEIVQQLKSPEFENTLISTREFEERMRYIHLSCSPEVLELYTTNLHRNLWEIDEMAADLVQGESVEEDFRKFAAQKHTVVKNGDAPKARVWKNLSNQAITTIRNKRTAAAITYQPFATSQLGWINCDRFMADPEAIVQEHVITINGCPEGVMPKLNLVLLQYDAVLPVYKHDGNQYQVTMGLPLTNGVWVATALHNDQAYFALATAYLYKDGKATLDMQPATAEEMASALSPYNGSSRTPNVNDRLALSKCCPQDLGLGGNLFETLCRSCHRTDKLDKTGPGLYNVLDRVPAGDWKYEFVWNSDSLKRIGEPYARKITAEWNGSAMNAYPNLTREEIDAIYDYIQRQGKIEMREYSIN